MKTPRLWRRQRDGKDFGSFHIYVRNKPINLKTQDADKARERRASAMRGARNFRDDTNGAAVDALAALGDVAQPTTAPSPAPVEPTKEKPAAAQSDPPNAPPPEPVIEPEPIEPERQPLGDWADDVSAAAAAPTQSEAPPAEAAGLRLQDLPWFDAALVTASKAAVGLQLVAQAWTMRLVGDVEAGRVGPPPSVAPPTEPESMSAFMKIAGARWDANDPREAGRAAYERTIVALVPQVVALPPWFKWLEAPIVTAIGTVPVQLAGATKIKRDDKGEPVQTEPQPEAPAGATAA